MTNIHVSKRMLALAIGGAILLPLDANAAKPCEDVSNAPDIINFIPGSPTITLKRIGTRRAGYFNSLGSEIVAYDPSTKRLFVVNQGRIGSRDTRQPTLDVLDIVDPYNPKRLSPIDLSLVFTCTTSATSVAVKNGIVALAVYPYTQPCGSRRELGKVLFYRAADMVKLKQIEVGDTPDMVIFTPDGNKVLVANQGSPSDGIGGSVSIIDITQGVSNATVDTADFSVFNYSCDPNDTECKEIPKEIHILPASELPLPQKAYQSISTEYIAVSTDSSTAWVSLEVNNALAVVDIINRKVTDILPLTSKNYGDYGQGENNNKFVNYKGEQGMGKNRLDASTANQQVEIRDWPVYGMYQPDAIEAYVAASDKTTYLVTANEGINFPNHRKEVQELKAKLDPEVFNNYPGFINDLDTLLSTNNLGQLRVTDLKGDDDKNGIFEKLYTFGGRSFSIWSVDGTLVYDSGDDFEQITASALTFSTDKSCFNTDDNQNVFDNNSRRQGPEPDGVTVAKINGHNYAFVALVRPGGIMVYDITDPTKPIFQQYINNRNFRYDPSAECTAYSSESDDCASVGDLGPEGVLFIAPEDSPNAKPLLVVANQTSSSTTLYQINECAPEVISSQVNITRGGFRYNRKTGRFVQVVTLKNIGSNPVQGPLWLVMYDLSQNATLANTSQLKTECIGPLGSPYLAVNVGTDNVFSPGESATVVLEFDNPSKQGITYNTRLLAGAGDR